MSKKTLNGDSPVFMPAGPSPRRKTATLPLQAASAVPFMPRAAAASPAASPDPPFNVATVREFVPRSAERTPPAFPAALAREFQPRGDRSPFTAHAVEFRPQGASVAPSSLASSAPIHSLQPSPETTAPVTATTATTATAATATTVPMPATTPPSAPAKHVPSQSTPVVIPTGPARGADGHLTARNHTAAAAAASANMSGLSMAGLAYALPPGTDAAALYDSYGVGSAGLSPFNPYATGQGREGTAYFQSQTPFGTQHQPLNEHLYFPIGPHRQDLLPRQRTVHDFFLPEKLRQDIHMKSRASHQAALTLSVNVESYHSLTPLDTNSHKVAGSFGRITWLYKAVASKNGKHYCLRRLENFRVSHENALRAARDWRRVSCANVVMVHEAFTTRAFGDSSVVFATDYFPLSVTLLQYHFPTYGQNRPRSSVAVTIQETVLWGYVVQLANALRAIHGAGLAARSLDLTKILRTGKNRIRLSGCAVQDVIHYDPAQRVEDLQQDDLVKLGEALLALATYTPPGELRPPYRPLEQIPEIYSDELKAAVAWLLEARQTTTATQTATTQTPPKTIDAFITGIAGQMARFYDMAEQENDGLLAQLYREVENGRVARMLLKLGTINERDNYQRDATWAEHGPRYPLKLFRDYVFHQVDESGRPVLDVWHMLSCLNKLDAGSNEVVRLSSRDGRTHLFVTYKEMNKMVQRSFNDLLRASRR